MDYSPPGSSIHGIFQAREVEWGAIAFSRTQLYKGTKDGYGQLHGGIPNAVFPVVIFTE